MADAELRDAGEDSPHLDKRQQRQAAERKPLGPLVIHEIVREQGKAELERSSPGLAWSGLAAGSSIGFSFLAQAYLRAGLPEAPWARLVDAFGYALGFLIVILGRQQLFTETTLTALVPALTERTAKAALGTLRVWGIVLLTNMIGTWIFGAIAAIPGVFSPEAYAAMSKMAEQATAHSFWQTSIRGVSAGWLIGLMVWLLPGSGVARPIIIILLTYTIAMCEFPHIVAGSVEAAFGVASGHASVGDYVLRFFIPTLLGNVVGGTALAALSNHAQVAGELRELGEGEVGQG